MNTMLSDIESGRVRCERVLVTSWESFGNTFHAAAVVADRLDRFGVLLEFAEESAGSERSPYESIAAARASTPAGHLSKWAIGVAEAVRNGRWPWRPPKGYSASTSDSSGCGLVPNDDATLIRSAFEALAAGDSVSAVLKGLRQAGFQWNRRQFLTAMRNPVYCGRIRLPAGAGGDLIDGQHEPLITVAMFSAVQKLLDLE